MTQQRSYTFYALDELGAEARTKVLNESRYINVDDAAWYEPVVEGWTARLAEQGYEDAKILFSGFYAQGDGACFEAMANVEAWLTGRGLATKYRRLLRAVRAGEIEGRIRHTGCYYHAYSTDVELSYTGEDDGVARELEEVERLMKEDVVALGQEIYRDLEREYSQLTDDEAVAETIRLNGYLFHLDGCKAHHED